MDNPVSRYIHHHLDSQRSNFKQFGIGASLFMAGMLIIYSINTFHTGEASLRQEVATFIGILFVATGFISAITAQLFMVIYRFKHLNRNSRFNRNKK